MTAHLPGAIPTASPNISMPQARLSNAYRETAALTCGLRRLLPAAIMQAANVVVPLTPANLLCGKTYEVSVAVFNGCGRSAYATANQTFTPTTGCTT